MSSKESRRERILAAAETVFGSAVQDVQTPGGSGRASYRLIVDGRSVIGTLRPNFRRTHLEANILRALSEHCDLTPKCLGVVDEVMFQSDLGGRRLNQVIAEFDTSRQQELAANAVASIFRIQSAGRKALLHDRLPHLGNNDAWVRNLVDSSHALEQFSVGRSRNLDLTAIYNAIAVTPQQFLKWDCRSGNAALGAAETVLWFDFEYAGVRHGAEDIAWLIGDEAWPVSPETMEDIVIDAFDPECGHTLDDYLDYLSLYVSFHCVQRLKLIVKEARKRGWLSKARIRKYDDAGVHPEFAVQICRVGSHFSQRNKLSRPLHLDFVEAEKVFQAIIREGEARLSA